jgi:hypothetical protein
MSSETLVNTVNEQSVNLFDRQEEPNEVSELVSSLVNEQDPKVQESNLVEQLSDPSESTGFIKNKKMQLPLTKYVPFDWDGYLIKTGTKAAPAACFFQNTDQFKNEFKPGYKLETNDPRNTSSICIATVIEVRGARLRLRLDGSDDRNDFWKICDSKELHPFEYSTKKGIKISPPMGFSQDLSRWPKFIEKMIQSAGEGLCTFAPESIFIEPPLEPKSNSFAKGQKIEAVDQRDPRFIYPATVRDVAEKQIQIGFDGYNQYGEYWCSFTSRDIFPVGWCNSTGHELQCPGNLPDKPPTVLVSKIPKVQSSPSKETNQKISSNKKKRQISQISEAHNKHLNSSSKISSHIKTSSSSHLHEKRPKKSKKSELQDSSLKLDPSIEMNTNSSPQQHQTLQSTNAPTANITVYDWNINNVVDFLKKIDEGNSFSEYINLFKEQKIDGRALLKLNVDILVKHMNFKIGPAIKLIDQIDMLRQSSPPTPCTSSTSVTTQNETTPVTPTNKKPKTIYLIKNNQKIEVTEWTIDQVSDYIKYVGKESFADYAHKFKQNNIDGKTLISLDTQYLIENFQMKLGQATYLNAYLEKLRKVVPV